MQAAQALEILDRLSAAGVGVWVDGGWGVDALLGEQTREHEDLDLVVALDDEAAVRGALEAAGFALGTDERPTRFVMAHPDGRAIDCHPVRFDAEGGGLQAQPDGSEFRVPPEGFTSGEIDGRSVPCISADVQLRCHVGYAPEAADRHDVVRLCARFGLPLPRAYRSALEWTGEDRERDGVWEREFALALEDEATRGGLFTPAATSARPGVALMGHGFTTDRRCFSLVPAARALAGRHGFAAVSIDMPGHGSRFAGPADASFEARHATWAAQWRGGGYERIPREWQRTLAEVEAEVGPGPVGYWGLSLGTQYGIMLLGAEPRIRVAVLGLFGSGALIDPVAARLRCAVAFVQQEHDALHPLGRSQALFERIGSPEKRLLRSPGAHEAVPPAVYEEAVAFLARHLGAP